VKAFAVSRKADCLDKKIGLGGLFAIAMSDQRSAISNERSAISNERSAISNEQSAISNQQQISNYEL